MINYYITEDDKIILTRNVLIYDDSIYENLSTEDEVETIVMEEDPEPAPIFFADRNETANVLTSRVGKENPNS